MKAPMKHGHDHHGDEAQAVNESPVVRSGLAEPTVMGTPVLAEDLYATHSDILDPPVRSFAQWEDEEKHGSPPPLSTDYQTHLTDHHVAHPIPTHGQDLNYRQQLEGGIWKPTVEEIHDGGLSTAYETRFTDPTHAGQDANEQQLNTGEKQVAGITGVLKSFDKMKVFHEPNTKSSESSDQNETKVYSAGSHDQFKPEPAIENPELDTVSENPSHPNISYIEKIRTVTSAISNKAAAVKNTVVSKLSDDKSSVSSKTNMRSSFPTDFSHKVADTLSGTLGPVYETVAGTGSSVMKKMQQGAGDDDASGTKMLAEGNKEFTVKEYLVDTFKPRDEDKVLSEVITHAFHQGKGNLLPDDEASTTTYVIRDEGERRLQDSCN